MSQPASKPTLWEQHVARTRAYSEITGARIAIEQRFMTLGDVWRETQQARKIRRNEARRGAGSCEKQAYGEPGVHDWVADTRPFAPKPVKVADVDADGEIHAAPWFGAAPCETGGIQKVGLDVILAQQELELARLPVSIMFGLLHLDDVYVPAGAGAADAQEQALLDMATEQSVEASRTLAHQQRVQDAEHAKEQRMRDEIRKLRAEQERLIADADRARRGKKALAEKARRARIAEAARMLPDGTTVYLSAGR